jgi:hypothetical protein
MKDNKNEVSLTILAILAICCLVLLMLIIDRIIQDRTTSVSYNELTISQNKDLISIKETPKKIIINNY